MRPTLRHLRVVAALICCGAALLATAPLAPAQGQTPSAPLPVTLAPVPMATLERQAQARVVAVSRSPLADTRAAALAGVVTFEEPGSGRVPNYLRALALKPQTVKPFASFLTTVIYGGTLEPEVKLAMALRVAQLQASPYAAVHLARLLRLTPRGAALADQLRKEALGSLPAADRLALRYAELLTRDIHGVDDETFRQVRGYYNDAHVVELTATVCFFNYFTRLVEGLGLPVEPWALNAASRPQAPTGAVFARSPARVALIGDEEIRATAATMPARPGGGAPVAALANSQRAMLRVPDVARVWREYFGSTGDSRIGREIQLQVSFAVSMANGCRYCTLHQVQGLRGLGVKPAKLLAMEKSDDVLTPEERTAVTFARTLTRRASAVTDADVRALQATFGEQGALEVLLQTCMFSFMNRFTDGLRLPSEDEAVRVYREVYGRDFRRR